MGFTSPRPTGNGFDPPGLLRNAHLQSVLAGLELRRPLVLRHARALLASSRSYVLDCGDGVQLQGFFSGRDGQRHERRVGEIASPLAVLIHGWEGSADSLYLISLASYLYRRGFAVFRLNLRDHGRTHHLNEGIFHSCRIAEAVGAVKRIHELFPDRSLCLGGYSLGANFALRIALRAPRAGIPLVKAAAVSPVLNPARTLQALERGWFAYRRYFLRKWLRSLRRKQECFPELYDFRAVQELGSITAVTDYLVRHHSEFPDLHAYLNGYALTGEVLADLEVPSHILAAEDDPMIPAADYRNIARPDCLGVTLMRCGGHCGFFDGWSTPSWAEREVQALFAGAPDDIPASALSIAARQHR